MFPGVSASHRKKHNLGDKSQSDDIFCDIGGREAATSSTGMFMCCTVVLKIDATLPIKICH